MSNRSTGRTVARLAGISTLRQSVSLLPLALKSARAASWSSLTIMASVLLVVLILNFFLAMTRGFDGVASSAGADDIVVLLGAQSQSEASSVIDSAQLALLENATGLIPLSAQSSLSPEFTVSVSRQGRTMSTRVNGVLRGVLPEGLKLRNGFRLVEGRMFTPGRYELTIGRTLAQAVGGPGLGSVLTLAGQRWSVVGIHAMASAIHETEYLGDLHAVTSAYRRDGELQSVRVRLKNASALSELNTFIDREPRLQLEVFTERALYQKQMEGTTTTIRYLGWPLIGVLAFGALAGMINTLLIMLDGRHQVLATLRALGFSPMSIRLTLMAESVLLALAGALIATAAIYVLFDGRDASFISSGYTTVHYQMQVDAAVLLQSVGLAVLLGLLSGALTGLAIKSDKKSNAGSVV